VTRSCAGLALGFLVGAAPAAAQVPPVPVSAESLRASLFAVADDSMGGRATGSIGNFKAAEWVAAAFRRYGLEPDGENGSFFQTLPIVSTRCATSSRSCAGAIPR